MWMLQETTEWDCGYHVPNHTYITNDSKDKVFAYVKENSEDINILKNPLSFESRNRKFIAKRLPKQFESMFVPVEQDKNVIEVTGSKGDKYYVENNNGNWSCTCVGYKYHGTCKHIKKVQNND